MLAVKNFMSSLWNLPKEQRLEVALPEEQVFTCTLTLPMMPDRELAEAVRWELTLHVPFEEGYHYNYKLLGKSDGMLQVEAYVVSKEVVAGYDQLAKGKGLVLTALCFHNGRGAFNLLLDAQKRLRAPKNKLYNLGAAVAFGLGLLLLAGGYCYGQAQLAKLNFMEAKLQSLQIWQQRYEKQEAMAKRITTLTRSLEKLERERLVWSEALASLGSSMPKNCWLTRVKQKEASKLVEVYGKARGRLALKSLLENLRARGNFEQVTLLETGTAKDDLLSYKLLLQGKGAGK